MNDIDPNLQRLRELEARIAFAEHHIAEQRALVQRLARMGLRNSLAHELLRSMEDSLTILRLDDEIEKLLDAPAETAARIF